MTRAYPGHSLRAIDVRSLRRYRRRQRYVRLAFDLARVVIGGVVLCYLALGLATTMTALPVWRMSP